MGIYSTPYTLSPGSKNKKFGEVCYARFSEADGVRGLFKMGSAPYAPIRAPPTPEVLGQSPAPFPRPPSPSPLWQSAVT